MSTDPKATHIVSPPVNGHIKAVADDRRKAADGRRAVQIYQALFQISDAVNTTDNLDELYRSIHQTLGNIIDLTNFYIAIYNKQAMSVYFPYLVDTHDPVIELNELFSLDNSLTGEVIKKAKPIFLTQQDLEQRRKADQIRGTIPVLWIGVPLMIKDEVIGVMATQSYTDPDHFDHLDMDLLNAVSNQVAIAIERKRSQQALKASEEKYRNILDSIEDGYFEVDLKGDFIFFNPSVCRMLGYSAAELMGKNNRDYMDAENARKIYRTFNAVYRTGRPAKASDWRLTRKDGSGIDVETSVSLITGEDGQPAGFRGIARDITDRKLAEQRNRHLEQRLQQSQKLEALGKLAGGIAHDFNNILMGIQGRASIMRVNTDQGHPHYRQLENIQDHIDSAAGLTSRLLGFARGGKYEVKPTDLNALIGKCIQMFGRTRKEVSIHTRCQADLWTAAVDPNQLEQVFLNLFVNAWQAMPGGGHIDISTENRRIDENESRTLDLTAGNYVQFCVSDTGVGMDKEMLPKIFDPFFTTKETGRGSGLGLASVYGIVKNHHGAITVDSRVGRGSAFTICLPATTSPAASDKTPIEQIQPGRETVLLVDDEDIILDVGRQLLELLGHRVVTARSGKEALEIYIARANEFDLVILDMIMPEMDGGQLFDRLRAIDPSVLVLLSSGYSLAGQAADILNRGCNGFIQKPFTIERLSTKLRDLFAKSSSRH